MTMYPSWWTLGPVRQLGPRFLCGYKNLIPSPYASSPLLGPPSSQAPLPCPSACPEQVSYADVTDGFLAGERHAVSHTLKLPTALSSQVLLPAAPTLPHRFLLCFSSLDKCPVICTLHATEQPFSKQDKAGSWSRPPRDSPHSDSSLNTLSSWGPAARNRTSRKEGDELEQRGEPMEGGHERLEPGREGSLTLDFGEPSRL